MINLTGVFVLATSYSRTAFRRTTIGAAAFHCRVRNGNGWCHCATVTRVRRRTGESPFSRRGEPMPNSGDWRPPRRTPYNLISKEHDFQSAIRNRKSAISSGSLISTYGERDSRFVTSLQRNFAPDSRLNVSTIHATSRASFCFEIFPLLCLPSRLRGMG